MSRARSRGLYARVLVGYLMSGVPVVAAFGPIVVRPAVGEVDGADSLDVLDAVFDGNHEPQRSSVFRRERLAVHFIAEECLGMQGAVCVERSERASCRERV